MKSLRFRIGISYIALVLITVGISVFAIYHFSELGRSVGQILRENYGSVLAAENMVKSLERQENAQLSMQVGDFAGARDEFFMSRDAFYRWYGEALAGIALPEEPAILDRIETAYDAYLTASDTLHHLIERGQIAPAAAYHARIVRPLAARLRGHNFQLLEVNQNAMLRMQQRVEAVAGAATTAVLAASVVAILLSIFASVRFARGIVGPISHLTRTVRRIGRGHLNQQITITTDDELAELGHEFNRMTERLLAYEAMNVQQLVAEKRKSELLVAAMPNPVIVADADERVLLLNEAAEHVLGRGSSDGPARTLREMLPAGGPPRRATDAVDPSVVQLTVYGEPHYFRRRQTVIDDEALVGPLVVVSLEDVTHFKQLDQMKSDFLATVSHELRTPLTSLGMALDLLMQEVVGRVNETQRDLLETAKSDSERLRKLIADLLYLARLESGAYRPQHEPVAFGDVVDEALAPLRLPFREQGVALRVALAPGLPLLAGDPKQLAWTITNLAGNALRYTPAAGAVTVAAHADAEHLYVRVIDTGRGIPPEAAATVFDRFVQLKTAGEHTPGSVGLGLAIARKVVELHGGRIWVEPTPGGGSTFCFDLPLTPEPTDGVTSHERTRP